MISLTRRHALIGGIASGAVLGARAGARATSQARAPASPWALWYRFPARHWVEALPIGTGRLGAMVFGGAATEELQLNEDSFWAGGPYDPSSSTALESLPEVRRLVFAGQYAEAQALAQRDLMARPIRQMSYQTLGSLFVELAGTAETDEYRRWLDLETAITHVEWLSGGRRFRRMAYASASDQVIVVSVEAEDGGPFDCSVRFSAEGGRAEGDTLWLSGRNESQHGVEAALTFAAAARLMAPGAAISPQGSMQSVANARSLTVIIAARTNYRDWQSLDVDPVGAVRADLDRATARADRLLERHVAEHRRLFGGFDIDLGSDPFPGTPTDERIRYSHEQGRDDPYLAALYVQYARYLLISCSRPGCQPANLQGLWNNSNRPPWGSKYTININTEMNYWPAEPLGLGECVEPLIRMVEDLAGSGKRTARVNYGARGWVVHHNTDLWRATAPIDGAFFGLWPTGGAWLCKHLWDRWDYGRDIAVLRRIYPLLLGAGLFFLDTMVEHPDGSGLVTCPSISPENAHHPEVSICAGPAMDRQILRELFANIIEASELLRRDEGLRRQLSEALSRIPGDRIGEEGQLQEWLEDWDMDVPDIQHRHVSHLYALHPGHEIRPETPELFRAARRSLAIRGDDATGWGIGWRINLWARLGEGARAYTVLRKLLGPDRTYPNMFDAHPPFQIDGNFGGAAGILEMLVRDQPDRLELLPALPRQWPTGSVGGVRLRGGLQLDLGWENGLLQEARLTANRAVDRRMIYKGGNRNLDLQAGQTVRLTGADFAS